MVVSTIFPRLFVLLCLSHLLFVYCDQAVEVTIDAEGSTHTVKPVSSEPAKPTDTKPKKKISQFCEDVLFNYDKKVYVLKDALAALNKYPRNPYSLHTKAKVLEKEAEKQRSNALLEQSIDANKAANEVLQEHPASSGPSLELHRTILSDLSRQLDFLGRRSQSVVFASALTELPGSDQQQLDAYNTLGLRYLDTGKNADSESAYLKALSIDPNNAYAQAHIGMAYKFQFKYPEAAKYLQLGVDKEPSAQTPNFYYQLGESYERSGRRDEALRVYGEAVTKGFFFSTLQRSTYNARSKLTGRPWWSIDQTPHKEQVDNLIANWEKIRDEVKPLLDDQMYFKQLFNDENEGLTEKGQWREVNLWIHGRKQKRACATLPFSCGLLEPFSDATQNRMGQVKFSIMHPGTHVWAHCGPTNARLRMHIGLIVPEKTFLRVGDEIRSWKEGEYFIFDDSFEHEVWHNGTSPRMILIVDFWHPELPLTERKTLAM